MCEIFSKVAWMLTLRHSVVCLCKHDGPLTTLDSFAVKMRSRSINNIRHFSLETFWRVTVGKAWKSTGVTNITNDDSVPFRCVPVSHDSVTVSQHEQHQTQKQKQVNRIHPSLILIFTPVLFLLWHVKNGFIKKELRHECVSLKHFLLIYNSEMEMHLNIKKKVNSHIFATLFALVHILSFTILQ